MKSKKKSNDSNHLVYVAFYDSGYENVGFDIMNSCVKTYGGGNFTHTQIVFGSPSGCNYTCSVDDIVGKVYFEKDKKFKDNVWSFVTLKISKKKELALINFLNSQVGKLFSWSRMFFGGFFEIYKHECNDDVNKKWFCSELVCGALKDAHIINDTYIPINCSPQDIYKILV